MVDKQTEENSGSNYITITVLLIVIAFLGWKVYALNKDLKTMKDGSQTIYDLMKQSNAKNQQIAVANENNKTELDKCIFEADADYVDLVSKFPNMNNQEHDLIKTTIQDFKDSCYRKYPLK